MIIWKQWSRSFLGIPIPTITWSLNGNPLTQNTDRSHIYSNGTLIITNPLIEDAGVYKCEASNYLGSISAIANVKVNGKALKMIGKEIFLTKHNHFSDDVNTTLDKGRIFIINFDHFLSNSGSNRSPWSRSLFFFWHKTLKKYEKFLFFSNDQSVLLEFYAKVI